MAGQLVLLHTSPRVAPGLLSLDAARVLFDAGSVHGRQGDAGVEALAEAGVAVDTALAHEHPDAAHLARALVSRAAAAGSGAVVWLGALDGEHELHDAIAVEVSRHELAPDVEVVIGSWDVPGARLLDVVTVMDRLRSPGGCPWDAQQTHASLVPYLIEEAHELADAVRSGNRDDLIEELGDVLLQVAFQARVAEDHPSDPFDIDEVAAGLVDKLVRRHPHVFADAEADSPEQVEANWEQIKAVEKAERTHPLDGVPTSLPALALADKYASRLARAGQPELMERRARTGEGGIGERLLALVLEAREQGVDAEQELRAVLGEVRDLVITDTEAKTER